MEENSFWGKDIKNYQSNAHFEYFKNNKKKFFIFAKKGLMFKIEKNDDYSMVQDVMSN